MTTKALATKSMSLIIDYSQDAATVLEV